MNFALLYKTLKLTSVSEKKQREYLREYLKLISLNAFETITKELDKIEDQEKSEELAGFINDYMKHKKSLDIANDEKAKAHLEKFTQIVESIEKLPQNEVMKEKIFENIEKIDEKIIYEIMSSCSKQDREKIVEYMQETLDNPK